MRLGIDFGTSFSSAALVRDGNLVLVKEPVKLGFSFPSSAYLTERGGSSSATPLTTSATKIRNATAGSSSGSWARPARSCWGIAR